MKKKKLKALHAIVYGDAAEQKTAKPGELIPVTRENFPGGGEEVERLIRLGAAEIVGVEAEEGTES